MHGPKIIGCLWELMGNAQKVLEGFFRSHNANLPVALISSGDEAAFRLH